MDSSVNIKNIFHKIKKSHLDKRSYQSVIETDTDDDVPVYKFTEDNPGYVKFPVNILVDVSKKLLDLNRGVAEPDHRDALFFRKAYTVPDLLKERIQLDADKTMRNVVRKITYRKNLSPLSSGIFQGYVDGLIVGNPLSMPLEQMNPMQMVEQSRRFTQMGPGGIASSESITQESQNVDPSEFYFIDLIAGPESEKIGIDTRAAWNTKLGSDGKLYQKFYDRNQKAYVWMNPYDVSSRTVLFPE